MICARENKTSTILDALESRLEKSVEEELETGLREVEKICRLRLLDLVREH